MLLERLRQIRKAFVLLSGLTLLMGGFARAQGGKPAPAPAVDQAGLKAVIDAQAQALLEAEAKASAAKAKQESTEAQNQAAAGAKAVAENAKLLKSGVTAGVSAGIQFPIGSTKGTSLQNAGFVAMPYVAFFPGYWKRSEAVREYCASEWGGGSESDASAAAMEVARRKATLKFNTFISAMNAGATDLQILDWESSRMRMDGGQYQKTKEDFVKSVDAYRRASEKITLASKTVAEASADGKAAALTAFSNARTERDAARGAVDAAQEAYLAAARLYRSSRAEEPMPAIVAYTRIWLADVDGESGNREARKKDIIQWIADQDWNSTLRGKCFALKWGAYLGRTLNNEVRVRVGGGGIEKRNYVPQLSFGATFAPNAYVSVLAGVTVGNVEVQGEEGTPRDPRTLWSGNVSVGGNFDLAAALLKGAQSLP
ncbi:hypothetical protein [Corallococcus sp. AB049A]|uniref:hypothetical protein n=1 Tax=Corallococcus sp. AB049A TaxID=2316721 RepID=UPI0011C4A034|nr:hypothetical protein [Corallococcus sp. AB049A]